MMNSGHMEKEACIWKTAELVSETQWSQNKVEKVSPQLWWWTCHEFDKVSKHFSTVMVKAQSGCSSHETDQVRFQSVSEHRTPTVRLSLMDRWHFTGGKPFKDHHVAQSRASLLTAGQKHQHHRRSLSEPHLHHFLTCFLGLGERFKDFYKSHWCAQLIKYWWPK